MKLIKNFIPNIIKTITLIIKALVFSRETLENLEKELIKTKEDKKTQSSFLLIFYIINISM